MRRIAIIGANNFQLPLIKKAKEMGLETHVFAWRSGDVGEKAADYYYPVSIVETDRIIEICRQIKPDGVVTIATDLGAISVIRIATALGLPCNPVETASIATNKYLMRRALQEAGLSTPRFVEAEEGKLAYDLLEDYRFPVIVKPTDRSGSRGVSLVNDPERVSEAIERACWQSFEKKAIIEEYIQGDEFSCECITQDAKHHMLSITRKYTTGAPHYIEKGHLEPSGLEANKCLEIREHVFRALDALHVKCGASHSEFKLDPQSGEVKIIEIGARMGGDCIGSDLVFLTTGQDYVKMVIQCAMGQSISFSNREVRRTAAVRFIMNEEDYNYYCSVKADNPPELIRADSIKLPGRRAVTDSSNRFGFYIVAHESSDRVKELANLR